MCMYIYVYTYVCDDDMVCISDRIQFSIYIQGYVGAWKGFGT